MPMSRRFASRSFAASIPVCLLALGCNSGGAPLTLDPETPSSCQVPAGVAGAAPAPSPDAGAPRTAPATLSPDAGATPIRTTTGFWFSDGFVRDMLAAGLGATADYRFDVADAFSGFISYGMDIVTLNQSGTLASNFEGDWSGPPDMLVVGDYLESADEPIVPRTGYWLAKLVWDGMTNAVETTKGGVTIRESPGGRVHCERANGGRQLRCGFRGVVRADFR
jgi:hypothetical protein